MLRSALVAALAASVSAKTLVKKDTCVAVYKAVTTPTCADVVQMGRCFATEGITALPPTNAVRITAEHELILAQNAVADCVTHDDKSTLKPPKATASDEGDLNFDVHEDHEIKVYRYKREIVSLYKVASDLAAVSAKCANNETTFHAIRAVAGELASKNSSLHNEVEDFKTNMTKNLTRLDTTITTRRKATETKVGDKGDDYEGSDLHLFYKNITSINTTLLADIKAAEDRLTTHIATSIAGFTPQPMFSNSTSDPKWQSFKVAVEWSVDSDAVQKWGSSTGGSTEVQDQVVHRNYELVQQVQVGDNTYNNQNNGRWFYKVNYNVNNPGYWRDDRFELIRACKELSLDMKHQKCPNGEEDGLDRNLKPACNKDDGSCDNYGVYLQGSDLSHCGADCNKESQCIGMELNFLRGAVMYDSRHRRHNVPMRMHNGYQCHDQYLNHWGESASRAFFTICTAYDDFNKQKGPLAGCD